MLLSYEEGLQSLEEADDDERGTGNTEVIAHSPLPHLETILRQVLGLFSVRRGRLVQGPACKGRALTRPILRLCSESVSQSISLTLSPG